MSNSFKAKSIPVTLLSYIESGLALPIGSFSSSRCSEPPPISPSHPHRHSQPQHHNLIPIPHSPPVIATFSAPHNYLHFHLTTPSIRPHSYSATLQSQAISHLASLHTISSHHHLTCDPLAPPAQSSRSFVKSRLLGFALLCRSRSLSHASSSVKKSKFDASRSLLKDRNTYSRVEDPRFVRLTGNFLSVIAIPREEKKKKKFKKSKEEAREEKLVGISCSAVNLSACRH